MALSTHTSSLYPLDWDAFFQTSDIKILLYLNANRDVRYSELEKNVVKTRSVLSVALQDLMSRNLIERAVEPTKPIQTKYRLTDKGLKLVRLLLELQKVLL